MLLKFLLVKEYYQYSDSKTEEIIDLIDENQLKQIKKLLETGE